jgi:hypothetical protein
MSRVTFADVCPSIRCSAKTLTPALTERDAQVCRKSCGVMGWTPARFTAMSDTEPGACTFTAAEIRALHHGFRDFMVRQTFGSKPVLAREFHTAHAKLVGFVQETKTCVTQPESATSAVEELIDTNEAAAILDCTPQWVGRIRGRLGVREIGSQRVFPRQIVVQYAQRKAGQRR